MPFRYGHIIEEEVRQHRSDDVRSQQVHIKHDCVVLLKEERRDHVHGEQAHDVATEIENDVGRPLNRTQLVLSKRSTSMKLTTDPPTPIIPKNSF